MSFEVNQPQAGVVQMGAAVKAAPAPAPTYNPGFAKPLEGGVHPITASAPAEAVVQHPTGDVPPAESAPAA